MQDVPSVRSRLLQGAFDLLPRKLQLPAVRLQLAWQSRQVRRGRRIDIDSAGDHFVVDDGLNEFHLPDLRRAIDFRRGIAVRLDEVAGKYGGQDGLRLSEGSVVVDIGANIGEFSRWCAEAGAKVIAFEPDPAAYACLEKNLEGSGALLVPHAAWHRQQAIPFHCSSDTLASSVFKGLTNADRVLNVEAWTLDAAAAVATLPRIDLLKIDAQGAAPEVLGGASRTLTCARVVIAHVGGSHGRANLRFRVAAYLEAQGLQIHESAGDLVVAVNPEVDGSYIQSPSFSLTTY